MSDSTEDQVAELRAIEDIKRLKARYFRLVDLQQWDDFADLFEPDCEMQVGASGDRIRGRDEWVRAVSQGLAGGRTVHHGGLPEIDIVDGSHANGIWAMTDYVDIPSQPARRYRGYGHYREEYRRGLDGRWRISRLTLTYLRRDPL